MPGSIQVSVLDFKELPSSSTVKISLGKVEYEVLGKGAFSFPLTNLRDKLTIKIQDSEGNQVSHSGVPTMSILQKGVWDDFISVEGGGLIHMKLEFILSDEERNRVHSVRESAIKKKQAEILGSRLGSVENAKFLALSSHIQEVSDVSKATSSQDSPKNSSNNDTSLKASESFDGIKEESFQRQSFTSLEDKIPSDVNKTNAESTSNKKNEFLLQQAEEPKKLLEDTKTRDFVKKNDAVKTVPLDNLEDKKRSFLKKMSKERNFPPFSQETEANIIKTNEIQLQETDLSKRLKDSSSSDVGASRLTIAEKIKTFSPKLAGEMDKQASSEKTPQNIKKMISVFESSLSKDRVPIKPRSTKSNRFETSRLLKNDMVKDCYENSETSSSTRLRNSFSTGDLRKNISKDQVESDDDIVESAKIDMQSKEDDLNATEKTPKETQGDKTMNFLSNSKIEEKCHQEKGEESVSSESADIETSNGSFGQAMKIALVVGFGVVVLLFRQRETGKGKKDNNTRAVRNVVMMNKRGSTEEQRRRIGVSRFS